MSSQLRIRGYYSELISFYISVHIDPYYKTKTLKENSKPYKLSNILNLQSREKSYGAGKQLPKSQNGKL